MNKYEQMLFTMKSFEKSGQEKSAKKTEDKLVNALKISFEKGEAEALGFCQKYNIDPFEEDEVVGGEFIEGEFIEVVEGEFIEGEFIEAVEGANKPKEESKFFKWLSPYIDTLESMFFGLMAIAILWITIYIVLLWG